MSTATLNKEVDIIIADGSRVYDAQIPEDMIGDESAVWSWLEDWSNDYTATTEDPDEYLSEVQLQAINPKTRETLVSDSFQVSAFQLV